MVRSDLVHLPEWKFDRKRISANSNPNPKAQKRFRENEMTSFFRQVSRHRFGYILCYCYSNGKIVANKLTFKSKIK